LADVNEKDVTVEELMKDPGEKTGKKTKAKSKKKAAAKKKVATAKKAAKKSDD
jgi:hypothetical protein